MLVIYLLVAIGLITMILLQQGKNTDVGCSFGANRNALFGVNSNSNIITRLTAVLAIMFFVLSLVISNLISSQPQKNSQLDNLDQVQLADQVHEGSPSKMVNDIQQSALE